MSPKVLRCPMCGELYEFYSHMVGDQSVCGKCRQEAKDNTRGKWGLISSTFDMFRDSKLT